MELSAHDSVILLAVLVVAAFLLASAQITRIPYPILLVVGGLGIALVPGMPTIELDPELVFVAFLPPLLYGTAFFTSLRELRSNIGAISLLAVGLVLVTTVAVAWVGHAVIPGVDWPTAFVLGAIVSPTDPTAATAIAERVGLPRRLVGLIDGESLLNDGTALVAYRVAVIAVVSGSYSVAASTGRFFFAVAGGIAVGLVAGYLVRQVRRRLDDPPLELTISLLTGYVAFLPAQALGVSAVLAAVTVGIYMGWHTPELTNSQTRLQGQAIWEIVFFILNAVLFMLVGLQLPSIVDALSGYSAAELFGWAALVTVTVTGVRFAWIFATARLPGRLRPMGAQSWGALTVLGWSGMRGAVSLAAALALPLTTDAGTAFPNRDLIIFLTFGVILGTLVAQGLTLPALIKAVRLEDDDLAEMEEAKARIKAAEAALGRLDEIEAEGWANDDTIERMRGMYGFRVNRFRSRFDPNGDGAFEERSQSYQRLRRELLDAERGAVADLRRRQLIDDEIARRVTRDLDLEDLRLDIM